MAINWHCEECNMVPCTFRPFDFYPNWKLKKLIWYFQYLCFLKSKNEFVFLKFNFLSLERWKSKLLNAILVIHLFKGKKLHVLISIVVVNCIEFISTILRFVKSKNWNRYSISVERKIENWQKKTPPGEGTMTKARLPTVVHKGHGKINMLLDWRSHCISFKHICHLRMRQC